MATAAQIQAEVAAGPQTQDALDALLVKYSPADLAAAFPQFGGEEQYATAKAEAEQREFVAWQTSQPAVAGPGTVGDTLAAQGITDPKNDPRLLAQAQEQIDRAKQRQALLDQAGVQPAVSLAPWSEPNWRETQAAAQQAEAERQRILREQDAKSGVTVGGGIVTLPSGGGGNPTPTTVTPGRVTPGRGDDGFGITTLTTPTPATSTTTPATTGITPAKFNPARIQAIQQWYNSNVGRTDPQAQGDLNRFLATSGYTSGEINTALPQWGLTDLNKAIQGAKKEFKPSSKDIIPTNTMPTVATGDYSGANLNVSNYGRNPFSDDLFSYFQNQSPFYYQDRPDSVERVGAIRDFYTANEGRTDPQAQSDLNRFLASGYTARKFNTALPQFAQADLEKAIGAAYKEFPRSENSSNLGNFVYANPASVYSNLNNPFQNNQPVQPPVNQTNLGVVENPFVTNTTVGPAQNLPNQTNLDDQGLAALYASLKANLFDANSQNAQDTANTSNTGIAGLAGPA